MTRTARKIVLLEANEIPYRIYDRFVSRNPSSSLARHLTSCRQYTTHAADTGHLSPWITWPTLHRGVNNEKHGIQHFGQELREVDRRYPPIWELLVEAGVRTGVFGPLHSWPLPERPERYDFFVPDTFAVTPECHPAELTAFQRFNLAMARKSPRNVSSDIDWREAGEFLVKAPQLGLRPKTIVAIAGQLLDERRVEWKRVRRRTYQPVLAFDLFMHQLERHQPAFSNFFTNHVASSMHRFWAAIYPDEYEHLELDGAWQKRFGGEIDFTMRWTDDFFDRLVAFADAHPEYLLVVASSMGQAAANGIRVETQLYLRQPARLLARAGIAEGEWERRPSMEPAVSVIVRPERCAALRALLERLEISGEKVRFYEKEAGFFDIDFGQPNVREDRDFALLGGERVAFSELGLECVELEDEAGSTGYHVPDGTLFVYDPADRSPKQGRPRIETTDVAPALLAHFGLPVPDYMSPPGTLRLA